MQKTSIRAVALVACLAWSGVFPAYAQEKRDESKRATRTALLSLQDAFSDVADAVEPAVVTIVASRSSKSTEKGDRNPLFGRGLRRSPGTGSGVIIRGDGWVLTNEHVVNGADQVTVRLNDGREFIGKVVSDPRSDLALIKIEDKMSFPTAKLGDSEKVKIGHWAIAIGSPYKYEGSFSVGVISNLNRRQEIADISSPNGLRFYPQMFQTDAAINPGNSGGPLCNLDGEVIAINTAIESDGGGSIGIGFAIPINSAKFVVSQLLANGRVRYGFLGVQPTSVTAQLASTRNLPKGALMETVQSGTPADKGGVKAQDVIVAIGERAVRNELDFRTIVSQTAPGSSLELRVVRNGQKLNLKVIVGELLEEVVRPKPEKPVEEGKAFGLLGLEVQALTDDLAANAKVSPKTKGVVIKSIAQDSPAGKNLHLEVGAVITSINGAETPSVKSFVDAINKLKTGDVARIVFVSGSLKQTTIVEVE